MGLEVATYVADLVATNPTASDPLAQGDDHIRLLKAILKASFPNVNAALDASMIAFTPTGNIAATTVSGALAELDSEKYSVGGALGTPASGNLANCTFPTLNQNTTGTATNATNAANIADGAVSTAAKIAANIIGVEKLAREGSAGQVLTSGGPSADPTWSDTPSVGVGQTWQNVLGSRVVGTTYTNSTGKPIQLHIITNGSSTNTLTIGGVAFPTITTSVSATATHSAIVPVGATYSVAGSALFSWMELR